MMTATELEHYLHTYLPLTNAMQVSVLSTAADKLVLQAPLAPNINPHQTVFGGSLAAIGTLAAWCLVYTHLAQASIKNNLVIRRSSLEYERAIASDFTATAHFVDEAQRAAFIPTLLETGKARIEVQTALATDAKVGVRFQGEFVALLAT